jgi:hypothetical protein
VIVIDVYRSLLLLGQTDKWKVREWCVPVGRQCYGNVATHGTNKITGVARPYPIRAVLP